MEHGLAGGLLGLALFLFPGLAWAAALAPQGGAVRTLALGVVLAFTVLPALLLALHLLFHVPLHVGTIATLAAAVGMAGLAARLQGPLLRGLEA